MSEGVQVLAVMAQAAGAWVVEEAKEVEEAKAALHERCCYAGL